MSCDDFETSISNEISLDVLKKIRKNLILHKVQNSSTISDKIADFIVDKVGTMAFFWFCVALTTTPLIFPIVMPVIQYISSGYLQLILLPLIMVAGNRSDKLKELRSIREYKILFVSDRIDEIMDCTCE